MNESPSAGVVLVSPGAAAPLPFEVIAAARPDGFVVCDAGYNRAPVETCMIEARDDIGAIDAWREEFADSPSTHRAYTKEIERFYNWLVLVQRKSLASVRVTDINAYSTFMRAPHPTWCGPRNRRRHTDAWRPFEGPLSPRSCNQALVIIGACFSYLVAVRYLSGNPFVVGRARRRKLKGMRNHQVASRSHFLSLPTFGKLVAALEHRIDAIEPATRRKILSAERDLFVIRFLGNTGLRRDELARASMADIERVEHARTGLPYWIMTVNGKGGEIRRIALNDGALDALLRYRRAHGATAHFAGNASAVLLPLGGEGAADRFLTDQMVYNIVRTALKAASEHYAASDPEIAARLPQATPHWLRHTFATLLEQLGAKPKLIQMQLGHASIATTMSVYVGTEELELVEAAAALRI